MLELSPVLLTENDGEALPLVILLSENSWLTASGSLLGSEVLVLELEESELLTLGSPVFELLALSVFKSSGPGIPKLDNTPAGTMLPKMALKGLVVPSGCVAATAGTMMAAANTTTKPPTNAIRRMNSSSSFLSSGKLV
jgi:hypothetical protein